MPQPILYDDKVINKLGKEAYDAILGQVRSGNIDGQQMADIASQLHPTVRGNHQRRCEKGASSDDYEMRHILSDWVIQELCMLKRETALKRLVMVFEDKNINLKPLARQLKRLNRRSSVFRESLSSLHKSFENEPELISILESVQGSSGKAQNKDFDSIDRLFNEAVHNLESDFAHSLQEAKKAKR